MNGRKMGLTGIALAMAVLLSILGAGRLTAAVVREADDGSRHGVLQYAPSSPTTVSTPTLAATSAPIATATFFSEIGDQPAVHTPPLPATHTATPVAEALGLTVFPDAGAGGASSAARHTATLVVLICAGASLLAFGVALTRIRDADR